MPGSSKGYRDCKMLTAREKFYIAARRQGARMAREAKKQSVTTKRISTMREHYQVPDDSLTLKQAAKEYHRSESGLQNAIKRWKLPSEKIGPYRIIKRSDLEEYIKWAAQARREAAYRATKARCEKLKACTN